MRYAKGTIALSEAQDIPVLVQVMNSQFVSQSQLWEFVHRSGIEVSRKSFCWRLARLSRHGIVNRYYVPVVDREPVYSLAGPGVTCIRSAGALYSGAPDGPRLTQNYAGVAHALGLNAIHLALLESGQLTRWQTEVEIRSQNELTTNRYAKDYDAIVTLQFGDKPLRFALEYERTAKAHSAYVGIRRAIESERNVDTFVYLAANGHIQDFLKQCFWQTARRLYIGLAADVLRRGIDKTEFVDAGTMERLRLRNLL